MRIWRRTEKISWTEHNVMSNEVFKLVEEERSLLTIIRTRQRNWMRHIMRGDSLQSEIIKGRMEGKRGRGRPRQKLLDWMMSDEYSKLKEEAQHRETWNHCRSEPARGQRTYRRSHRKFPKITTQQQWYRRRADKLSAAARRSTKVGGGGAHKLSAAAAGARLYFKVDKHVTCRCFL